MGTASVASGAIAAGGVGREAEPVAVAPSAESAEAAEPVESRGDSVEEPVEAATESESPDPGNREGAHMQTAGGGDGGGRRRRSRRGGRRRRGRGGDGREGGGGSEGGGGREGGGGGGGLPPRGGDTSPRGTEADRARDVASCYAPRDVAPSWISGQPLA